MAYSDMAYVYDMLMGEAPYDEWLEFTKTLIKKHETKGNKILDLGSGTGEMSIRLAKEGYQVTGVDYSDDMLSVADEKARLAHAPIQWVQQDLKSLSVQDPADAAVSYFDVMNYITEINDLKLVFEHVAKALKPEGIFLFDVHSIMQVESFYKDSTFTTLNDDAAYIWYCHAGEAIGEMYHDITFFVKDGENDNYRRFSEYHHQRTYSVECYEELLKNAGFQSVYFFGEPTLKSENNIKDAARIFILAKK